MDYELKGSEPGFLTLATWLIVLGFVVTRWAPWAAFSRAPSALCTLVPAPPPRPAGADGLTRSSPK